MGYWVILPNNEVRRVNKKTKERYGLKSYKTKTQAERVKKTFQGEKMGTEWKYKSKEPWERKYKRKQKYKVYKKGIRKADI